MKHRGISRLAQGAPSVQSDILGALDAIVASVEGFVSAARVPLCALEDTTTTYLEQLLHIDHTSLPVDAHWSGRNGEGTTVVWVPRDLVERLVVDCRLLSSVPSLQVEAECPRPCGTPAVQDCSFIGSICVSARCPPFAPDGRISHTLSSRSRKMTPSSLR